MSLCHSKNFGRTLKGRRAISFLLGRICTTVDSSHKSSKLAIEKCYLQKPTQFLKYPESMRYVFYNQCIKALIEQKRELFFCNINQRQEIKVTLNYFTFVTQLLISLFYNSIKCLLADSTGGLYTVRICQMFLLASFPFRGSLP